MRPSVKPSAADRRNPGIWVAPFSSQLLCRRGLSGDDAVVVIGVYQVRARLRLDPFAGGLSRGHRRLAENNLSAVALDGLGFYDRRILWHDDPRRDSTPRSRASNASALISARLREHAPRRLFLCLGAVGL